MLASLSLTCSLSWESVSPIQNIIRKRINQRVALWAYSISYHGDLGRLKESQLCDFKNSGFRLDLTNPFISLHNTPLRSSVISLAVVFHVRFKSALSNFVLLPLKKWHEPLLTPQRNSLTWTISDSICAGPVWRWGLSFQPTGCCHRQSTWLCWGGWWSGRASTHCQKGVWPSWQPPAPPQSFPDAALWDTNTHKPQSFSFGA